MSSNNTPMSSQVSHLVRQRETGSAHQVAPVSHQPARWRTWLDPIPRRLTLGEYPGTSCTQTAGLMGGLPWVRPYMTSRLPPPSTVTMGVSGRSLASTMWRHGTKPTPRKCKTASPRVDTSQAGLPRVDHPLVAPTPQRKSGHEPGDHTPQWRPGNLAERYVFSTRTMS